MQKLLLMLLFVSVDALAGLLFVSTDEIKTVYADPASKVIASDFVIMSGVFDFKTVHTSNTNQTYKSLRFRDEYNCAMRQKRNLAISIYSENMGDGNMIISYDDTSKWQDASGVSELLWKVACGNSP